MTVVWLLDASAIINIKKAVPAKLQWGLFKQLEALVVNGEIAFPKQVRSEVTEMAHPDAPGVWADGVFPQMQHPTDPAISWVQVVMASPAAGVVDPNKTRDDGDPYLLALALQIQDAGGEVCIVTDDHKDTAARIGLSTACEHLGLKWCRLDEFLEEIEN